MSIGRSHEPPPLDPEADPAAFLLEARELVLEFQRGSDRSGSRITRLYTAAVDNTLRALYARAVAGDEIDRDWATGGFCLAATGGYARKMLCPYSDVDVMLIRDGGSDELLEQLGRHLLYPLWDGGLDVGHHPGTIAEILAKAEDDITTQTALLDLRFVAGNRAIYERFLQEVNGAIERWQDELLLRVRTENLARFARFGESVFLLEPHVKEGKGGLRDIHWLGWIAKLKYGTRGDYDFLLNGLVEPQHYRALIAAYEFLLRVRLQLHVLHGRRQDRLTFESQEPVARALGFKGTKGLLAVERFMGEYYRHAYNMAHTCGLYVARMLDFYWDERRADDPERLATPLEVGPSAPVVRTARDVEKTSSDGLFVLRRGAVRCVEPEGFQRDPLQILSLFEFQQQVGGRLHHDTMEDVRASLGRVNKRFRESPDVGRRFRQLLEGPEVFRILVAMHRSGFLGRYVPEFGACFCQAQHNRHHLYTVDVHSLYVVRELESLGTHEVRADNELFSDAWSRRERRAPLLLAGLFHDIAKSHGSAHSRVGAEMALTILGRMGFEDHDIARVQWLVRYHLTLSDTAYHRDLNDPKTRAALAAVIPDREHLDDLLALTWADSRATNPQRFTDWQKTLLEHCYQAALSALEPGAAPNPAEVRDVLRSQVEALLAAEVGRKSAPQLAERLFNVAVPSEPTYLERTAPEQLATYAVLLEQLASGDREDGTKLQVATHVRQLPDQGFSQWVVCSWDRPGAFSQQAGVLTACGFSIKTAEAVSRTDGGCINTFAVTDARGRAIPDPARWRRAHKLLERVTRGERDLDKELERVRSQSPPPRDPGARGLQRIEVSNELSDQATVVELVTPDRVGLVYDVTQVMLDFGLDLRVAKIATRHDMASDSFYVLNRRGNQLGRRSRRMLLAVLREHFG
ncbi:MAG TPA: [protein-PII] uridylyltransferase [Deltaproteobacteria bacterium]|nr:[protein-PII] uridylyltransferase [Deltaproteobacteria bacterium]